MAVGFWGWNDIDESTPDTCLCGRRIESSGDLAGGRRAGGGYFIPSLGRLPALIAPLICSFKRGWFNGGAGCAKPEFGFIRFFWWILFLYPVLFLNENVYSTIPYP